MARKGLSKRTRFEVFKRDRFTCQYCGKRPPDVMLEVDHVVAVAEGGTDEMANLVTSCIACNAGKSNVPLGRVAPALDEMDRLGAMQEMLERRSTLKAEIEIAKARGDAEDEAINMVLWWWEQETDLADEFQFASVRRFLKHLSLAELRECVDAAGALLKRKPYYAKQYPDKVWKYFCGAAWKMIRGEE